MSEKLIVKCSRADGSVAWEKHIVVGDILKVGNLEYQLVREEPASEPDAEGGSE